MQTGTLISSINQTLREKNSNYSCKTVSWDDVSRSTGSGNLSCWGPNITDTRLNAKDGTSLYTVRPDNWNEKLGSVKASDVAVVVKDPVSGVLEPVNLKTYLQKIGYYGAYAGIDDPSSNLYSEDLDEKVSIRFQTTFLPVPEESSNVDSHMSDADGFENIQEQNIQFAPESYNYNTISNSDPRNTLLLATTQGLALQQDGSGNQKLFHHAVADDGKVHRYWFEAEKTSKKVGSSQEETKEEASEAVARGKATASVIGTEAMGIRMNVLMTIQVPMKQKAEQPYVSKGVLLESFMNIGSYDDCEEMFGFGGYSSYSNPISSQVTKKSMYRGGSRSLGRSVPLIGTSNVARVSRGIEHDTWSGVSRKDPERDPNQHITITVVMYYTVVGGVPSQGDVLAAVNDLENLYEKCNWSGKLAEKGASFMHAKNGVNTAPEQVINSYTPVHEPGD